MNWSSFENVGDQSDYVDQCTDVLRSVAPTVGPLVSTNHFLHFMDKLAADFCPKCVVNRISSWTFCYLVSEEWEVDHIILSSHFFVPDVQDL